MRRLPGPANNRLGDGGDSELGRSRGALSMEVFDEHQITAELIDLTVQNQPLIR
jgi:hypothetical protein